MSFPRNASGFTMIELVTILIIVGILAVVAIPRIDTGTFRATQFRDQTIAALRYAQKTASSHRRLVCVAFTANSVTLTIDHDRDGNCNGQALGIPGQAGNAVQSTDSTGVFAVVPATLHFQPNGQGTDTGGSITNISTTIDGATVFVEGATGYVGEP